MEPLLSPILTEYLPNKRGVKAGIRQKLECNNSKTYADYLYRNYCIRNRLCLLATMGGGPQDQPLSKLGSTA